MKSLLSLRLPILIFLLFAFWPQKLKAGGETGADISYICTGSNQYDILLHLYIDCSKPEPPDSIIMQYESHVCFQSAVSFTAIRSTSFLADSTGTSVPLLCGNNTCNGGSNLGVKVYAYKASITLPMPCHDWHISYNSCCRDSSITTIPGAGLTSSSFIAVINNAPGINNTSPFFVNYPQPVLYANQLASIQHSVVDVDGDSLVFMSWYPFVNPWVTATMNTGITITEPLMTNQTFDVDRNTGLMTLIPRPNQKGPIVICIAEYRNGVYIGQTTREVVYNIVSPGNQSPRITTDGIMSIAGGGIIDSNSMWMCSNAPVSFQFKVYDPEGHPFSISLDSNSILPLPSVTVTGVDTQLVSVTWDPQGSPGGINTMVFTLQDSACPVASVRQYAFNIWHGEAVSGGYDKVYCANGNPVQLSASNAALYSWSPAAGLSDPAISSPLASPTVTTVYVVTGTDSNGCISTDTVNVIVDHVLINTVISNDTNICPGGVAQLFVSGGAAYSWSPSAGLSSAQGPSILASPTSTTQYVVQAYDTLGCSIFDTVVVSVSTLSSTTASTDETCHGSDGTAVVTALGGVPPYQYAWNAGGTASALSNLTFGNYIVTVTDDEGCSISDTASVYPYIAVVMAADNATICKGDTTQVYSGVNLGVGYCGLFWQPFLGLPSVVSVGTDTAFADTSTRFPAIYGHFYEGARHLMLYRAGELLAAGFGQGVIKELGFDIAKRFGTDTYCNFTVKIGCTGDTAVSDWVSNLTTVYSAASTTIQLGWNMYNIDDFAWDGSSNLIVEVCFSNDACQTSYTLNSPHRYTTTAYNSVLYYRQDNNPGVCQTIIAPSTSNQRPNTRFKISKVINNNGYSATWAPAATLSNSNDFNPKAFPDSTTTYAVTVSDSSGCVTTDSITITVNDLHIDLPADTSVCNVNTLVVSPSVTSTGQQVQYLWTSSAATFNDATIASPVISFADTAKVYVTVHDIACSVTDSINILPDSNCYAVIKGKVYHDLNANCTVEAADTGLAYILVSADNQFYTFTDTAGQYEFILETGSHTLLHSQPIYTDVLCPNNGSTTINATQPGTYDNNHFYDVTRPDSYNLAVSAFSNANMVVGQTMQITYTNQGTMPQLPIVKLYYATTAPFLRSVPVHTTHSVTAKELTWSLPLLLPGQTRMILAYFEVNQTVGTILHDSIIIEPIAVDWKPGNNTCNRYTVVTGAIDPNDKHVSPQGQGLFGLITERDTTLNYLINFQNVGTAPAYNVVIRDTLDNDLDLASFTAGVSSHNYTLAVEGSDILVFTFANIMLPDSAADEPGSHGYITYSINRKPGLPLGTRYTNRAAIYFDNNPPVITNTTFNTLFEPQDTLGISSAGLGEIVVYPNPAQDALYITLTGLQTSRIEMCDQLGRVVATIKPEQAKASISTTTLPSGIYFIKAYTAKGIISRKVSVVH